MIRTLTLVCGKWDVNRGFSIEDWQVRLKIKISLSIAFPRWFRGKESACQAGDTGSIYESGRSPGEGNGTPVFLPRKSHGQRSLAGYCPWDLFDPMRVRHDLVTKQQRVSVKPVFRLLYRFRMEKMVAEPRCSWIVDQWISERCQQAGYERTQGWYLRF